MSDDGSSFFTVIVILWLIILTAVIVIFGVLVGTNRVDFGPTGPTGAPGGGTNLTLQNTFPMGLNQGLQTVYQPITTCQNVGVTPCSQIGATPCHCHQTTLNSCQPMTLPTCHCHTGTTGVLNTAQCQNCHFNTVNGISSFQVIEGNNIPQIVNFVLTTNVFTYDGMGTFTLPAGQYQVSATIVYTNNNLNNTKSLAFWLRNASLQNNVVSTSDLIGGVTTTTSQTLTKTATFVVTGLNNRFSTITWHTSQMSETIDNRSQFILRRVA